MKTLFKPMVFGLVFLSGIIHADGLPQSTSPDGAKVYIISPADGEIVGSNVNVKFGLQGMGIAPAGTVRENTGHHHLIVDGKNIPENGKPIGADVIHFGGGQTEKNITLEKGEHTLQLILGNYLHVPHNPPVISEKITIIVK